MPKTVQNVEPLKDINIRVTDTHTSNVFGDAMDISLKVRPQNTFKSDVFKGPTVNHCGRTKLGGDSSGTDVLFGTQNVTYEQSS